MFPRKKKAGTLMGTGFLEPTVSSTEKRDSKSLFPFRLLYALGRARHAACGTFVGARGRNVR